MRLLELFSRLDEARVFTAGTDNPPGGVMLYSTKRGIPHTAVLPADRRPLTSSEEFLVVRAKTGTGKKIHREKISNQEDDIPWKEAWYGWQFRKVNPADLKKYPNVWTTSAITGRAPLFRFLTADVGIARNTFEELFGPVPQDMGDEAIQFHNARLFVPTTMGKRSIDAATKTLESTYQYLANKGLEWLFKGDIRFRRLRSNVAGNYDPDTGDLNVAPNIKSSGQTVYSLLHEFGHKYMEEIADRDAIVSMHDKLTSTGEGHMGDMDKASAMQTALDQLQPGTQMKYLGRKSKIKSNPYYTLSHKERKYTRNHNRYDLWYMYNTDDPDRKVRYGIEPEGLINPAQWHIEGIEAPETVDKWDEESTDQWFVTEYAENNEQEWWAEIFAFYTMGMLHGAPEKWIKTVLSQRQKIAASVGSNDGEISSEDDYPPPPPERGNEEGRPEWEWTDPYHNSGEENAVNSNTP
jgi:hypothetical protein